MSIDPRLFASTVYGNRTALVDFAGTFFLWHRALAQAVFLRTGLAYRSYPIGDAGGREWLDAIQRQHQEAAKALGIAPPPDLASYDLQERGDFASFFFILSEDARRLRVAAGLA